MNKILLLGLFMFLLSSFVSAIIDSDTLVQYQFDVDFNDATPNNFDLTNNGMTIEVGSAVNNWTDCTQAQNANMPTITGNWNTIAFWLRPDTTYVTGTGLNGYITEFTSGTDGIFLGGYTGSVSGEVLTITDNGATDMHWITDTIPADLQHYVFVWNATASAYNYYINNTFMGEMSKRGSATLLASPAIDKYCGYNSAGFSYAGKSDEFSVFNKSLSSSEVTVLFNGGQFPYTVIPSNDTINESTEGLITHRQIGSVSFAGGGFNTIADINFNLTVNNSVYYFGHTIEVSSTGNNVIECRVSINGTVLETVSRTMTSGSIGNIYFLTNNQSNNTGFYNHVLECQRASGGGMLTVSKVVGVGHLLVDQNNNSINHIYRNFSSINADTTLSLFDSFNITTTNKTLNSNHTMDLILDYDIVFNHANHGNITVIAGVDGIKNCTGIRRESSSGVGSGANVCLIENVSVNSSHNITLFVQGDTASSLALDEFNIFVKEFLQDTDERNTLRLNGSSVNSTFKEVKSFNISNIDHTNVDIFAFAGISLSASSGISSNQINIINSIIQTGFIYNRTMSGYGVLGVQEILEDASIDEYKIQYNSSSTATSIYEGGDLTAYFGNVVPVILNSFNISVFDNFDNTSIESFSVAVEGGATFNGDGSTLIFTGGLVNITISSTFNGGYFNRTIINHDSGNDINVSLNQTLIELNFVFDSGDLLNFTTINVTDIITNQTFVTTNGALTFNPSAGSRNFSITDGNNIFLDFNQTLNFSALQNETVNVSINELFNVLTFLDANNSNPIENATITIFYPSGSIINLTTNSSGQVNFSYNFNGSLEFGNYIFGFSSLGFNLINISQTLNSSNVPFFNTYNVSRASLLVNIFDRATHNVLSGVNVSVAFVGVFNETVSNGLLFNNNLTLISGEYTIYVSAEGFRTEQRTFTFTNQENLTLNFYLLNLSDPNSAVLFASTTDSFFRKLPGSSVDLLEYFPEDLSFISVAQCITNTDGNCAFGIELNEKTYILRASTILGGETFLAETSSSGEIFILNNEIRNLIFYTRDDFIVSPVNNLVYSITESFVNNISNIVVSFNTLDGTAENVCVEYFLKQGGSFISVTGDTFCILSSSAIQNIGASLSLNRSNDYLAKVYIESSTNTTLKSFNYPSITSIGSILDDDFKGAVILLLLISAFAISLHAKNIILGLVLGIVLAWVEWIIIPLYVLVEVSVFKTIIGLISIYVAKRRTE